MPTFRENNFESSRNVSKTTPQVRGRRPAAMVIAVLVLDK